MRFLPLGLVILACGDTPVKVPTVDASTSGLRPIMRVSTLTLTPDSLTLERGDTARVTCVPKNAHGTPLTNTCTWRSTDTAVAKVSTTLTQTMTVRAYKEGRTLVIGWVPKYGGTRDTSVVIVSDSLLPSDTLTPEPPDSIITPPDSVPPVFSCSGTPIPEGQSIQASVTAAPTGTTFCLNGVYRLQQITPKAGQKFIGSGLTTTTISGGRILTGFTQEGGRWWIGGQTQQGPVPVSPRCEAGEEDCQWPEDLWIDEVLQDRVSSLSAVGPGRWFFDYGADKIYLGDDPAGHVVETSVTNKAFIATANDVEIRNLTVEKYAVQLSNGAIHGDNGDGWVIEDVRVRQAHATGIRMGDRWTLRRVRVDHNGQLGMAGGGTGSFVEDGEWDHNKTVGFQVGFSGGASKFFNTDGIVLRNNYIHHNDGNGIWLDIKNIRYLVQGNRVEDNFGQGIFVEISCGGRITGNQVRRNGHERGGTWLYGAGILIAHSPDVEVDGNTVEDNYNGIAGIQQNRTGGCASGTLLSNLNVHDNVIQMRRGQSGVGDGTGTGAFQASRNNRFTGDTYRVTSSGADWFAWLGSKTWTEWRAAGQDAGGSLSVVP
jgi:hypothetical protein